MKRVFFVLFIAVIGFCLGAQQQGCNHILSKGGASPDFVHNAVHGSHSMTMANLRMFEFHPLTNNSIINVNRDLTSHNIILEHAGEPEESLFQTPTGKMIDILFNHFDDDYGAKNARILENLAHEVHMLEMISKAVAPYLKLKRHPPSHEFCQCVMDTANNGIQKAMRTIALAIREPELIYGVIKPSVYINYNFNLAKKSEAETEEVLSDQEPLPLLDNKAAWLKWRSGMLQMNPTAPKDLALYVYCHLNSQRSTNMTKITPIDDLKGDCNYIQCAAEVLACASACQQSIQNCAECLGPMFTSCCSCFNNCGANQS